MYPAAKISADFMPPSMSTAAFSPPFLRYAANWADAAANNRYVG